MRVIWVPDCQVRKDTPQDHLPWIGEALVEYAPDAIVIGGDFADIPSLATHDPIGSKRMEGARYVDDIAAANEGFATLCKPLERCRKKWKPALHWLDGNHEYRIVRAVERDPKYEGKISLKDIDRRGFKHHAFLERLWIGGVVFSHYFQSPYSKYGLGGTITNMLGKIGASFVMGHVQGAKYGSAPMAAGYTWHGAVYGSCYLHREEYRGPQNQKHFQGLFVMNELRDGDYCPMPLSLDYLCRKYEGKSLHKYMTKKYPKGDWRHLS